VSLFCCSPEKPQEGKILSRINDYNLTLDEFQSQLAAELELDKDFKLTQEAKREFLEELIRKELLIQEARKLKLDRKEKFVRAMERYWESTLIRDMIDLKSKEIERRTYVSQEEIETRYKHMKESEEKLPPFKHVEEQIAKELKEKKKTRMLEEWISNLRKTARVEIAEELL
jgi:peptidyl-prolyl cis-trans isomerase C